MTADRDRLTLTGSRNAPKATLCDMLTGLSAFQDFLGVETEELAVEKVFFEARRYRPDDGTGTPVDQDIADDGRHVVIHSEPESSQSLIAGGSQGRWQGQGSIWITWFGPVSEEDIDDDAKAITDFAAAVGAVEDALMDLVYAGGGLIINAITQTATMRGSRADDLRGDPFVTCSTEVRYG